MVTSLLQNPVFNALCTGDAALARGNDQVKYFDEDVSPFAGFEESNKEGFDELFNLLPEGRRILYAIPTLIKEPRGWKLLHEIKGLQFVFDGVVSPFEKTKTEIIPLGNDHIEEMMQLAQLTRPGPFGLRTIDFGHYFGIFENGKLVSMTGQRLHVAGFTEISAVCTHPGSLGRGYAAALMQQQLELITSAGQVPYLHVREDNERAIALYKRLGFQVSRPMNFYFLKRK